MFSDKDMYKNCLIKSKNEEKCLMCCNQTFYIDYIAEARFCSKNCRDEFYKMVDQSK